MGIKSVSKYISLENIKQIKKDHNIAKSGKEYCQFELDQMQAEKENRMFDKYYKNLMKRADKDWHVALTMIYLIKGENMTSEDLKTTQRVIEQIIKSEIDEPMKDFSKIKRYLKFLDEIDNKRRETWNNEKFGSYEEFTDNLIDICDDIPF